MPQINYTTVGGDTLPSVAEACGHSGEWREILAVNPWIEESSDYMSVPPGSNVLLPMDWLPAGWEPPTEAEAATSSPAELSSMTAAELIQLANEAQTLAELDAIDNAAAGRVTVTAAVDQRRATLLDQGATA